MQDQRDFQHIQPLLLPHRPEPVGVGSACAEEHRAVRPEGAVHLQPGGRDEIGRHRRAELQVVLASGNHRRADGLFHIDPLRAEHARGEGRLDAAVNPDLPAAFGHLRKDRADRLELPFERHQIVPIIVEVARMPRIDCRCEDKKRRGETFGALGLEPRRKQILVAGAMPQPGHRPEAANHFQLRWRCGQTPSDQPRELFPAVLAGAVHIVAQERRKPAPLRPTERCGDGGLAFEQFFVKNRAALRRIPIAFAVLDLKIVDTVLVPGKLFLENAQIFTFLKSHG